MINPIGVGARLVVIGLLALAPLLLGNFRTFLLTEILIFGLFATKPVAPIEVERDSAAGPIVF